MFEAQLPAALILQLCNIGDNTYSSATCFTDFPRETVYPGLLALYRNK